MRTSADAKLLGLFGSPVRHSLSPLIQYRALRELGLDMLYVLFEVDRATLADAVKGARALGMAGFNLTHPLKEAVIPLLDTLAGAAAAARAVNTVAVDSGKLVGHNTDTPGFTLALRLFASRSAEGTHAVVLGSGGAARSAVLALLEEGASSVAMLARNHPAAQAIAEEMKLKFPSVEFTITTLAAEPGRLRAETAGADIIVNATPVGMDGVAVGSPLPFEALPESPCLVFDLVYCPEKTALLKRAEADGHATLGGLALLVCQASLSLEIWTGRRFDERGMMKWLQERARTADNVRTATGEQQIEEAH